MGWKDFLEKIKLADIQGALNLDQGGIINVKIENNYYDYHMPDEKAVKTFQKTIITPEQEKEIKEETKKRLEHIGSSLDTLSGPTMQEVVIATSTNASLDFIKKL